MATGECHCGAVAYRIDAELTDVFICHCSLCRRSTGSGGIAVVVVDKNAFAWTRGEDEVRTWVKPGHDWATSFCRHCGSTLPGVNDEARMYVPVGTLTSGGEKLAVAHHIHVSSKANWEAIGDAGSQHAGPFVAQPPKNAGETEES